MITLPGQLAIKTIHGRNGDFNVGRLATSIGEFVIKNADYANWNTLAKAMADHITYRNGPHRDQRLIKAERRLLIAA